MLFNPEEYSVKNIFDGHVCKKCGHDLTHALNLLGDEVLKAHALLHESHAIKEKLKGLHEKWSTLAKECQDENAGIGIHSCIEDLKESFPLVFEKD